MTQVALSFNGWRQRARAWLGAGVPPETAVPAIAESSAGPPGEPTVRPFSLPAALMRLLDSVSCYRAAGRYELMYRLAYRALYENPRLLEDAADPDVRHATLMDTAIRRDVHKMHAFVRFRECSDENGASGRAPVVTPAFFAWFEPEHEILRRGAVFFTKRFPNMHWTIATPEGAAVWDGQSLSFVESPALENRPAGDDHEGLWRTYYRSICNVARINPVVMQREMPQKYWKNLPEAAEIGLLIRDGMSNLAGRQQAAVERVNTVTKAVQKSLAELPSAGDGPEGCRRCDLWKTATQAVSGEGPPHARIMLVGEQPGDEEDLRGHPFVGPAGRVLDQAIEEAGLNRAEIYITNAVKHFKWEPRGKRRLHKKPDVREIKACNVWLEREIGEIKSTVIVALGATALRALTGATLSIDEARRQSLAHPSGSQILATYHPSAILRAEGDRVAELRQKLIADLKRAGAAVAAQPPAG